MSVSVGISIPKDGNIFGLQCFGGGQVAGMLGVGGFAGAGATFSKGTNSGPMKNFDRGGFGYGEADAGLGFAVGGSVTHSPSAPPPIRRRASPSRKPTPGLSLIHI